MINSLLEELRARKEKLKQENKSLKRKQRCLQDAVNILAEKVSVKELEDKQRELSEVTLPNISTQRSNADLAERCRKALEVSFGEIPMPNRFG
jgi:predicted transcriptional regulator